ncbi:MAG: hypothetical protein HY683_04975 [Chloroflexi bacterium]|nr:hypothetical protein [Chloroflexota bacterium]
MPEAKELTAQQLKVVAQFMGLELSDQRLEELAPQIKELMARISRLNELDLRDVEPAFIAPLQG